MRPSLFPPERIGIQLYSVADQVSEIGFAKVLEEVAAIGYRRVEFAGYTQGTTPEITVKELRKLLDDLGLQAIGSHVSPSGDDSMKKILEDAAVLGIPNVGISLPLPSQGPTAEGWKALSAEYNRYGELAAAQGVGFYLHNHFHEWFPTPDDPSKRGEDVLLAETDPRYVFFEMDIYWAHVGQWQSGQVQKFDPLTDYAIPHRDRYMLFHVKDGPQGPDRRLHRRGQQHGRRRRGQHRLPGLLRRRCSRRARARSTSTGTSGSATTPTPIRAGRWPPHARASSTSGMVSSGRSAGSGPGAVVGGVVAAVAAVKFKRTRSGRRVVRVTIEADEPVKVTLDLRRGRRTLARKRATPLAAGRHTLQLTLPRKDQGRRRAPGRHGRHAQVRAWPYTSPAANGPGAARGRPCAGRPCATSPSCSRTGARPGSPPAATDGWS